VLLEDTDMTEEKDVELVNSNVSSVVQSVFCFYLQTAVLL